MLAAAIALRDSNGPEENTTCFGMFNTYRCDDMR